MKKIICIVAVALALTILASGMLSGCNAKTSGSAANAGKNSAKKIDMTINKLEKLEDKDFKFPSAFGNDFFTSERPQLDIPVDCPPGVDCAPRTRHVNHKSYQAKHLGERQINHDGTARAQFLDKFDDLYVLCADISAANDKCKAKIAEINEENRHLKQLSKEMKRTKKRGKENFAKFNMCNRQLNESVSKLSRDRNNINAKVKAPKKARGSAVDVEAMTMRNLMILNKVENRLRLLEDTHEKLLNTNESIRLTLGQGSHQPIYKPHVQTPDTQMPSTNIPNANVPPKRNPRVYRNPQSETKEDVHPTPIPHNNNQEIKKPEEKSIDENKQSLPHRNHFNRRHNDYNPAIQHDMEEQLRQQQIEEFLRQHEEFMQRPKVLHRFRSLPYPFVG